MRMSSLSWRDEPDLMSPVNKGSRSATKVAQWEKIVCRMGNPPCKRSLHAAAIWQDNLIVFGGYDGHHRVNDLFFYCFSRQTWNVRGNFAGQQSSGSPPSPRDRHVAVVWGNGFYIFGGFDGAQRVNDLHLFDMETNLWSKVVFSGAAPSPRHSHAAVVYNDSMYIFGGYDGSYRCDFHEFNLITRLWTVMPAGGDVPRPRYRGTCVVHDGRMILHGGHDGSRHLQDTYIYDFDAQMWSQLITDGHIPSPRDSHVAVVYGRSMFIFGGSTGMAMNDFHELRIDTGTWSSVPIGVLQQNYSNVDLSASRINSASPSSYVAPPEAAPPIPHDMDDIFPPPPGIATPTAPSHAFAAALGSRFCHVGAIYEGSLYIFGGYDGNSRLNDFIRLQLPHQDPSECIPSSTLISDLKKLVNCDLLSDLTFIVDGQRIFGHKILCLRCPFFHNMLTGEYKEARAHELQLDEIRVPIFLMLLEFLYTDFVEITLDSAMELLRAADRFGIERLKKMCEHLMLSSISSETAPQLLLAADYHNAEALRERCMCFILNHFDDVSTTVSFEEMTRANLELTLEIIKRRIPGKVYHR